MSASRNWRAAVAITAGWELVAAVSKGRWPYITDLVRKGPKFVRTALPIAIGMIVWDHFQDDERRRFF